jgi:hypothetical protein
VVIRRFRTVNDDPRALLQELDPKARDDLRRVLIRDQADRDAISAHQMRRPSVSPLDGRHRAGV